MPLLYGSIQQRNPPYQQQAASSLSHIRRRLDIFESQSLSTRIARQSLPLAKEVRTPETSGGPARFQI